MSSFLNVLSYQEDDLGGYISFLIKKRVYPLPVIFKTVYWFTDKYYVFVDECQTDSSQIVVRFRLKDSEDKRTLIHAIQRFSTNLVDQSVRYQVRQETNNIRDVIVKKAFSEALSPNEQKLADLLK